MEKQLWTQPYLTVQDERREGEFGTFRVRLIDFAKGSDRSTVPQPVGVKRFGWLLITGSVNDPVVGSEDDPMRAMARALGVLSALLRELRPLAEAAADAECAGCGAIGVPLEACGGCGRPACEACYAEKSGCGCGAEADRASPLTAAVLAAGEKAQVQPPSRVVSIEDELAEETARLKRFER